MFKMARRCLLECPSRTFIEEDFRTMKISLSHRHQYAVTPKIKLLNISKKARAVRIPIWVMDNKIGIKHQVRKLSL